MRFTWLVTASVLATTAAGVGLAGPAAATDDITMNAVGTFDVYYGSQTESNVFWGVAPCDDDADQCVQISEYSSSDLAREKPRWTKKAFWNVGSWILEPVDAKRACEDKTRYGVTYNYAWDAATNAGYRSFADPGVCPDSDGAKNVVAKFHLVRVGPAALPAQ
jgi:hypothetical protein